MKVKVQKKGKTKTYNFIDKWSDVTLEKWVQLINTKTDRKIDETIESIQHLSDMPKEIVRELSVYDVAAIAERLGKMQKEANSALQHMIVVDGVEYGFHPNLEDITIGEFADIEMFIKGGVENNMHKIAAVLYRPITEKVGSAYTIEAYGDDVTIRSEQLKQMTAEQIQSSLVFFWSLGTMLLKIMPSYLMEQAVQRMKDYNKDRTLQTSGHGLG
tara:strand:- start:162 stop:806 length:645 start_codon:yes stop_codon:yes gene_type:complete